MPKLDRKKLEAALKRTAKVAAHGPRAARAGRYLATGPAEILPNSIVIANVSSTAIDQIAYDEERRELRIKFKSGRTYAYDDVPAEAYQALIDAASQGAHFNRHIRDEYEFREVR